MKKIICLLIMLSFIAPLVFAIEAIPFKGKELPYKKKEPYKRVTPPAGSRELMKIIRVTATPADYATNAVIEPAGVAAAAVNQNNGNVNMVVAGNNIDPLDESKVIFTGKRFYASQGDQLQVSAIVHAPSLSQAFDGSKLNVDLEIVRESDGQVIGEGSFNNALPWYGVSTPAVASAGWYYPRASFRITSTHNGFIHGIRGVRFNNIILEIKSDITVE